MIANWVPLYIKVLIVEKKLCSFRLEFKYLDLHRYPYVIVNLIKKSLSRKFEVVLLVGFTQN